MSTPGRMWRGLWRRFRRDEESWEEAESGEFRVRPALLRGIALYFSISDGPGSLGCHGANEKKNIELLSLDGRVPPKGGGTAHSLLGKSGIERTFTSKMSCI